MAGYNILQCYYLSVEKLHLVGCWVVIKVEMVWVTIVILLIVNFSPYVCAWVTWIKSKYYGWPMSIGLVRIYQIIIWNIYWTRPAPPTYTYTCAHTFRLHQGFPFTNLELKSCKCNTIHCEVVMEFWTNIFS